MTFCCLYSQRQRHLLELALVARLRGNVGDQQIATAAANGFAANGHNGMLQSTLGIQRQLYQMHLQSAYQLALAYANADDWKDAVAYLKVSLARHKPENIAIAVSPALARLRGSAEFRVLLSSAGLSSAS